MILGKVILENNDVRCTMNDQDRKTVAIHVCYGNLEREYLDVSRVEGRIMVNELELGQKYGPMHSNGVLGRFLVYLEYIEEVVRDLDRCCRDEKIFAIVIINAREKIHCPFIHGEESYTHEVLVGDRSDFDRYMKEYTEELRNKFIG